MIHGDLHRDNILVQEDAMAFIDFDDCGTGPPMLDLAALVESFCRRLARSGEEQARIKAAILGGYHAHCGLPSDVETTLREYVAIRLLIRLGYVISSDNVAVGQWGPSQVESILKDLERHMDP